MSAAGGGLPAGGLRRRQQLNPQRGADQRAFVAIPVGDRTILLRAMPGSAGASWCWWVQEII